MLKKEEIKAACEVNLIQFMIDEYPNFIVFKNGQYRSNEHNSLVFYEDHAHRFSNGWHGNNIQYLQEFHSMSFYEAVQRLLHYVPTHRALKDENGCTVSYRTNKTDKMFYKPTGSGNEAIVNAYLKQRGISQETLDRLIAERKLYAASVKNESDYFACFANDEMDFYILRNGITHGIQKMIVSKDTGGFWYWNSTSKEGLSLFKLLEQEEKHGSDQFPKNRTVYVCEAPIDALSLYELKHEDAVYVAMAGLKEVSLNQIKNRFRENKIILAVDNDEAGDAFCEKHGELERVKPRRKDWNEDLRHD